MNIFQRFLISRYFYFIVAAVVIVMVGLTVNTFLPKRTATTDKNVSGLKGLFGLANLFDSSKTESFSIDQTVESQLTVSLDVANWEKKVAGRFVWRRQLPLTSDKYFIYFDLSRKVFIGRLYPDNDDLIAQIQAEATRILKKDKGIPLQDFQIDWDVYPRSSF